MDKKTQKQRELNRSSFNELWSQKMQGTVGVIIDYDKHHNTATVVVSKNETGEADEILNNVPCPYLPGIQMVAPEPGLPCWVNFKDGVVTQPIISHYYNHRYDMFSYERQSRTDFSVPNYLMW